MGGNILLIWKYLVDLKVDSKWEMLKKKKRQLVFPNVKKQKKKKLKYNGFVRQLVNIA